MKNLDKLAEMVAKEFHIQTSQLKGWRGPQPIVMARWAFIWLACCLKYADKNELMKWTGATRGRVNYALRAIKTDLANNAKYRYSVFKVGLALDPEFSC